MKVSIITPSYNQGRYIRATIESVLNQSYKDIEYLIIDGGSTDNTLQVIEEYRDKIAYFISEPDNGQAAAINKGLRLCTGDIIAYLNADDLYESDAVHKIVQYFKKNPQTGLLYGDRKVINEFGQLLSIRRCHCYVPGQLAFYSGIPQETAFWRKKVSDDIGLFDEQLNFCLDRDYWIRISKKYKIDHVPEILGSYRLHTHSKSYNLVKVKNQEDIYLQHKYYFKYIRFFKNIFLFYMRIYKFCKKQNRAHFK